jgi:hypothetical protein
MIGKNIILPILLFLFSILLAPIESVASQNKDEYVSLSKVDCDNPFSASGTTKSGVHLDCKTYHQTTDYTCGPAAVMTLLRYYGRISPSDMNQKTELRIALEMGATDAGTSMSQVTGWLNSHNFNIVDSGTKAESEMIIKNLKKGIPTMFGVNHHWILAKGFNEGATPDKDEVLFSDSCCNTTIISSKDIDSMWLEGQLNHLHNNNCNETTSEYIVATPK